MASAAARLRLLLAAALAAAALLALPATASAAAYGPGAPIPFALLPADNPWNLDVSGLPVDPNSADYIARIGASGSLHPDFGTVWNGAPNGIPYVVVSAAQPKVPVSFYYADESDPGPYPIPPDAPIEGGPDATGDRHVLVLDADDLLLYELFDAHPSGQGWTAGSGAVFDLRSNALRPDGWTSADAAGLPMLPGLVRYDEVQQGVIDHALRFTVSATQRAYVYPATHLASSSTDPDLPPMGLRLRLKAGFDISGLPACDQIILQALKTYGMFVADNGSSWYLSGAPDSRWDDDALHALSLVKGSDFEVVDTSVLPRPGALTVGGLADASVLEGGTYAASGWFRDETAGALSWTGSVDYGEGGGVQSLALGADKTFALSHLYRRAGRRLVTVTVAGDNGAHGTARFAVTVINRAPRVYAGADARVRAGVVFARRGRFTDPGLETYKASVTWGDGSGRRTLRLSGKAFTLRHAFPRARGRTYTVSVTVVDGHGGKGIDRFRVAVR